MTDKTFTAAGIRWSAENPMIVAEIGTGHGGDPVKARELVDAALESGAHCAKFQIVYADEILHPDTGIVNLPGGPVRLYDRFRELELSLSFYADMSDYCAKRGILFLCSPFGPRSLRELASLKPPFIKIASPELNHLPLLKAANELALPLALSSGVSLLGDIEKALEATKGVKERILLHCVTSYPAPEEDYNLRVLSNLSAIFGIPAGVSDHSMDPVLVPLLAVSEGAAMIEKHICLSRSDPGLDDPVALPPDLFRRMSDAVRSLSGKGPRAIREEIAGEYGEARVQEVLGSGVKALAPSERANYGRTNRSLHYMRDMEAGERIREGDVAVLRTEKILTVGLAPEWEPTVTGSRLSRGVRSGAGVCWEDLL